MSQQSEIAADFLDLWEKWSRSFDRDVTLEAHADIDEEFRNFARDHADAIASEIERLQPVKQATGED